MAATASATYSSASVKSRTFATSRPWVCVTLSKRSAATPRLASPHARSLSGLFRPIVSSRSAGPEPPSSTTAVRGPGWRGRLSVPGTASGPVPTVTSCSSNAAGSA